MKFNFYYINYKFKTIHKLHKTHKKHKKYKNA